MLAAHNARSFDVPFLRSEFTRCKAKFPSNWFFVDTLTLAREMMKSKGLSLSLSLSLSPPFSNITDQIIHGLRV